MESYRPTKIVYIIIISLKKRNNRTKNYANKQKTEKNLHVFNNGIYKNIMIKYKISIKYL